MIPNRFNVDYTDPFVSLKPPTDAEQQRADCDAWWQAEIRMLDEYGAHVPAAEPVVREEFMRSDIFDLSPEEFLLKWQRINRGY